MHSFPQPTEENTMKNVNLMSKLYIVLTLLITNSVYAGQEPTTPIPEPSILSLFAVIGVVVYILKKRNK